MLWRNTRKGYLQKWSDLGYPVFLQLCASAREVFLRNVLIADLIPSNALAFSKIYCALVIQHQDVPRHICHRCFSGLPPQSP